MTTHWIIGPGAIGRLLAHSLSPLAATKLIGRRTLPENQNTGRPLRYISEEVAALRSAAF